VISKTLERHSGIAAPGYGIPGDLAYGNVSLRITLVIYSKD
jgi:hypothetical protein